MAPSKMVIMNGTIMARRVFRISASAAGSLNKSLPELAGCVLLIVVNSVSIFYYSLSVIYETAVRIDCFT